MISRPSTGARSAARATPTSSGPISRTTWSRGPRDGGAWTAAARAGSAFVPERPTRETVGRLYSHYYTHVDPLDGDDGAGLKRRLRNGYLNARYGYDLAPASPPRAAGDHPDPRQAGHRQRPRPRPLGAAAGAGDAPGRGVRERGVRGPHGPARLDGVRGRARPPGRRDRAGGGTRRRAGRARPGRRRPRALRRGHAQPRHRARPRSGELLQRCAEVLVPGGRIWVATRT